MAGKFLSMEEAAAQLGISAEHLRELTQKYEVNGLRDGANFKYKPEEIERAKAKLFSGDADVSDSGDLTDLPIDLEEDTGDDIVLLSEVELGESGPGTSATVIGPPGGRAPKEGSDIAIFTQDNDLQLGKPSAKPGSELKLGGGSDLGLDLGSALNLGGGSGSKSPSMESGIALGALDDDDELVLHSPGSSDITLSPGDSGISLGSPADSGLSLDEPLNLGGGESGKDFDLAGDDLMLESDSGADLKTDDEFLLTPSDEAGDDDSDASGSQVIEIPEDSAEFTDADMLEEDTTAPLAPVAVTSDSFGIPAGAQMAAPVAREVGYSGLQIVSLSFCVLFLCLAGMFMVDLNRNMWAWNGETSVNSSMMDAILNIFG
jgi:hypothetical protein